MDKNNNNIQDKIDSIIHTMDAIENVKVSPFFKDKTMQRLFREKEEVYIERFWFTPKLQLATLVCVIVLNVLAFRQLSLSTYNANIDAFSKAYGLSSETETSLFNR